MAREIHVYLHHVEDRETSRKLDMILNLLMASKAREKRMAGELEGLRQQVAETKGVSQSAIVLMRGLRAKLDELASREQIDPAEIRALTDELDQSEQGLAAAVVENTVAAEEEEPA